MRKHFKLGVANVVGVVTGGLIVATVAIGGVPTNDGKLIVQNTKGSSMAANAGAVAFEVANGGVIGGSGTPNALDAFDGTTVTCNTSRAAVTITNGTTGSVSGTAFSVPKPSFGRCTGTGPLWTAFGSSPTPAAVKTAYTNATLHTGWSATYVDGDAGAGDEKLGPDAGDQITIAADANDLTAAVGLPTALTHSVTGGTNLATGCEIVNTGGSVTGAYNDLSGVLAYTGAAFGIKLVQNPVSTHTCPATITLPTNAALGALSGATLQAAGATGDVAYTGTYDLVPVTGDR
jgi:hypothetical protein